MRACCTRTSSIARPRSPLEGPQPKQGPGRRGHWSPPPANHVIEQSRAVQLPASAQRGAAPAADPPRPAPPCLSAAESSTPCSAGSRGRRRGQRGKAGRGGAGHPLSRPLIDSSDVRRKQKCFSIATPPRGSQGDMYTCNKGVSPIQPAQKRCICRVQGWDIGRCRRGSEADTLLLQTRVAWPRATSAASIISDLRS